MPPVSPQQSPFGDEFTHLTQAITDLGFDGVLYSFYPKPMYLSNKVQPTLHFCDNFTPFVVHYINSNYGNRDFVLRLALDNTKKRPIDWWDEIHAGNVTPEERVVTEDARKNFGIHYGLSIPALTGTYAIAGISVISKNQSLIHFQNLKQAHMDKLFELSRQYHAKIISSTAELRFFLRPFLDRLNGTQRKVLKHLLDGKPMKAIPQTDGKMTQRYAEKVLLNLRKEFGDISTTELIYMLGMINARDELE